jgi:hypothetical protein
MLVGNNTLCSYGNDADGWSEERRFLSPPNLGIVPASGIKIIAYGDAGTSFCDGMYPKNCGTFKGRSVE